MNLVKRKKRRDFRSLNVFYLDSPKHGFSKIKRKLERKRGVKLNYPIVLIKVH